MDKTDAIIVMTQDKYIYFNDLTSPFSNEYNIDEIITQYANTVKESVLTGFRKVCYENGMNAIMLNKQLSLGEYCVQHQKQTAIKALIGLQKKPYIEPDSKAEECYINTTSYTINLNQTDIDAYSFAAAYLNKSILIGFATNGFQNNIEYLLKITKPNEHTKVQILNKPILCVTHKDQFLEQKFIEWSDKYLIPEIIYTTIPAKNKNIHLSDHHGSDDLKKFACKLIFLPYIIEVVNSIDMDSRERKLIHNKHDDIIELRLLKKNNGYGLAVRTTARNEKELNYICKLLEEKFKC